MIYLKNVTTLTLDKEKCTGCKRCLDVCPRTVLRMQDKKVTIDKKDNCIECGACQLNCAYGALTVKSGVGCAQALFNALIFGGEPTCDCERGSSKSTGCC